MKIFNIIKNYTQSSIAQNIQYVAVIGTFFVHFHWLLPLWLFSIIICTLSYKNIIYTIKFIKDNYISFWHYFILFFYSFFFGLFLFTPTFVIDICIDIQWQKLFINFVKTQIKQYFVVQKNKLLNYKKTICQNNILVELVKSNFYIRHK